jgi:hypothetical protein
MEFRGVDAWRAKTRNLSAGAFAGVIGAIVVALFAGMISEAVIPKAGLELRLVLVS